MNNQQTTDTPNTETPNTNRTLFDAAAIFSRELFSDEAVARRAERLRTFSQAFENSITAARIAAPYMRAIMETHAELSRQAFAAAAMYGVPGRAVMRQVFGSNDNTIKASVDNAAIVSAVKANIQSNGELRQIIKDACGH